MKNLPQVLAIKKMNTNNNKKSVQYRTVSSYEELDILNRKNMILKSDSEIVNWMFSSSSSSFS